MEDIFCRRHFQTDDPIPEEKCKVDEVQAPLAMFGGIMALVQGIMSKALGGRATARAFD